MTASNNIHAGIGVSGGAATLTNITASANPWGIIFWAGGTASLNGATISNNTTGGILVGGSPAPSPSIQNVALNNNSGFAMSQVPYSFTLSYLGPDSVWKREQRDRD